MKIKLLLVFLFGIVSLQAQSVKKPVTTKKPVTNTAAKAKVSAAVGKPVAKAAVKPAITDAIYATIATNKGDIVLELAFKKAPVTVANFIALAEGKHPYVTVESLKGKPFYDGLKFHRVINDFMIQGGDPSGNGSGGPGYSFKDEITDLKHNKAGTLSMANSGPATNGSQFFITHKDTPWLDGKHTVFGYVTEGMPIVNAIVGNDVITKVTITRKGPLAKKFDAPKVFSDYFKNKAEDQKKQDAANAEAKAKQLAFLEQSKKAYNEKYGAVIANKKSYLANVKSTATTTPTGLMYAITEKGTGAKPAAGTTFYFHYAGFFEDGNLFDSSMEEVNKTFGKFDANRAAQNGYRPFPFEAGKKDGMIPGFIEGLENMGFGDKAVVFIPSNLAYGERGAGGVIPPNTMLIFELEMREKQE